MAYGIRKAIEWPIFVLMFALVFADSVTTNWMMYRTCYITLGLNQTECALIGTKHADNTTAELIEKTQPHVTIVIMAKTLIEAFGSAIVCFFIGPWSDKYGRRPILLLCFGGYILDYTSLAIESTIHNLSPWYMLICVMPQCFTGGLMAIFSVTLSYITDTTSTESRGIRIAIFHSVAAVGYLTGSFASSYALAALGYTKMYITAACIMLSAWLFIFFILSESAVARQTDTKIKDMLKFSVIKTTVTTTFKKRGAYGRSLLVLTMSLAILQLFSKPKDSNIYLYLQQKLHWSLQMFTTYNSVNIVIEIIGSVVGTYCFPKLLGVREPFIIMLGFLSVACGALIMGLANTNWMVYAAAAAKCLDGIIRPMAETQVSKIVPPEDTGKVFAFMAMCQNIISPLGSPMYTFIYNSTLSTFPETFIFVTAGLYVVGMLLSMVVVVLRRKDEESTWQLASEAGKFL